MEVKNVLLWLVCQCCLGLDFAMNFERYIGFFKGELHDDLGSILSIGLIYLSLVLSTTLSAQSGFGFWMCVATYGGKAYLEFLVLKPLGPAKMQGTEWTGLNEEEHIAILSLIVLTCSLGLYLRNNYSIQESEIPKETFKKVEEPVQEKKRYITPTKRRQPRKIQE